MRVKNADLHGVRLMDTKVQGGRWKVNLLVLAVSGKKAEAQLKTGWMFSLVSFFYFLQLNMGLFLVVTYSQSFLLQKTRYLLF